jgi:hypothetical protein
MTARSELIPYIYTAWRAAYDTGVSLLRPMYYEYPQFDLAYGGTPDGQYAQYFFGPDMIVAPIVAPASQTNLMATSSVWIPPGSWYEKATGALIAGASDGSTIWTKSYDLSEVPIFIRAGAVIASIPIRAGNVIATAQQQYTTLVFTVYPGAASGSTKVYEDDGKSMAYLQNSNAFSWTTASYTRSSTQLTFTSQLSGSFAQMPTQRAYQLRIVSTQPPSSVMVNGKPYTWSRFGGSGAWHYSGRDLTTIIDIPVMSSSAQLTVQVQTATATADSVFSGLKGGIHHATLAKVNLDASDTTPGSSTTAGGYLSMAVSAGELLSMFAGKNQTSFNNLLNSYRSLFTGAVQELAAQQQYPTNALMQLWDQDRLDSCLCGTYNCMQTNNFYQQVRIEGYQPLATAPGAIPLNAYWSDQNQDNWVTTQTSAPAGYSNAIFPNGYIFATKQSGVCV